jgi:Ni/Co efflux regulator RcnB
MLNKKLSCCAIAVAAVCALPAVHAQDRDSNHRDNDRYEQRHDVRGHNDRDNDHDRAVRAMGNRGEGEHFHHNWHRGDRIPDQYRHGGYVVNDWRGHHLHAPPRGYHWVNVDGDYVLVAVATGIIAELALNSR